MFGLRAALLESLQFVIVSPILRRSVAGALSARLVLVGLARLEALLEVDADGAGWKVANVSD